jgi:hypothetical protein
MRALLLLGLLANLAVAAEHCQELAGSDLEMRGEDGREWLPEGRVLVPWPDGLCLAFGLEPGQAPPVSIVAEAASLDGISEISVDGQVRLRVTPGLVETIVDEAGYDRGMTVTVETPAGAQPVRLDWRLRVVGRGRSESGVRYDRYAAQVRWRWGE